MTEPRKLPLAKRLTRTARILGPSSAAARALSEYVARTEAGERVEIVESGPWLFVRPAAGAER